MKYTFTIIVILLAFSQSSAQRSFAPVGAQWHHDMQYGIFKETVTKDTVINGVSCTKVEQKAHVEYTWYARGLKVNDLRDLYFTSNSDTVFVYNTYFRKFTPAYVFNVSAGDTITLPVFPPLTGGLRHNITDSTFSVLVDSVKMEVHDTSLLKTVYTQPISDTSQVKYTYNGAYAQRLGAINSGLLPHCMDCPIPTSDAIQFPGAIRCYSDSMYYVKLTTGDCAKNIKVSVEELSGEQTISISPNPATNVLHIKGIQENTAAVVYNTQGQVVSNTHLSGSNIDVSALPAGVYYLHLIGEYTNSTTRFIKD